jgi:hypothetical protein
LAKTNGLCHRPQTTDSDKVGSIVLKTKKT